MSSIDFELLPACFSFKPYVFQKKNSQFSNAVFSLSRIFENLQNGVLQFINLLSCTYMQRHGCGIGITSFERINAQYKHFAVISNFSNIYL